MAAFEAEKKRNVRTILPILLILLLLVPSALSYNNHSSKGKQHILTAAEGTADNDNRPNIIVVMTDDQRWDTVQYMPNVLNLASKGVTFSNSFATTALCCPSRSTFLTGLYAHHHGVWTNEPPFGGAKLFNDSSTLATSLQDSGYRTALIGKYLNGYWSMSPYIPPGWDEWQVSVPTVPIEPKYGYYDYKLNENGQERFYGNSEAEYSTDVLRDKAIAFIQSSSSDGRPFFLWFTPYASHSPNIPAPRHVGSCNGIPIEKLPSFGESDVSDKPPWIAQKPVFDDARVSSIERDNRAQICSLKAVDDAVGAITAALGPEIDNTVIIFTTDNGYIWGEHRIQNKNQVYEEAIRVPLIMHSPNLLTSSSLTPVIIDKLVANIDLAPTIADLANVTLETQVDGMSLLPLINDQGVAWRDKIIIEQTREEGSTRVNASAVRTSEYKLVQYVEHETNSLLAREFYDLSLDPYELDNSINDPQYAQIIDELSRNLAEPDVPDGGLPLPDFTPSPSTDEDNEGIGETTDENQDNQGTTGEMVTESGGMNVAVRWTPAQLSANTESTLNLDFSEGTSGNKIDADVIYDLRIFDTSSNEVYTGSNQTALDGTHSQTINFPNNENYRIEVEVKGLIRDGQAIDETRNGIARGTVVVPEFPSAALAAAAVAMITSVVIGLSRKFKKMGP